jgi:hypothetical protein
MDVKICKKVCNSKTDCSDLGYRTCYINVCCYECRLKGEQKGGCWKHYRKEAYDRYFKFLMVYKDDSKKE